MKEIDELDTTEREVNEAAIESEPDDDETIPFKFRDATRIQDGQSDVTITLDCDPSESQYRYLMAGCGNRLSHTCTGTINGAEETGLMLYAICASLKSISRARVNEALCGRYGFASRSAAITSGKRLIITLRLPDPNMILLGRTITGAVEDDVLMFMPLKADRDAWHPVTVQLRRFAIKWEHISPDYPTLATLKEWAAYVLGNCPHGGPVFSGQQPMKTAS